MARLTNLARNLQYPKSLAKMKLDGKAVKPGKAVLKKGTHKLIIWSKDGKVQRVTFKIK